MTAEQHAMPIRPRPDRLASDQGIFLLANHIPQVGCFLKHSTISPFRLLNNSFSSQSFITDESDFECASLSSGSLSGLSISPRSGCSSADYASRRFECNVCGKRYTRRDVLKNHMRQHTGEKPHQCRTCGKSFTDRSNMIMHEKIHSGIKQYDCKVCGKAFTQRSTLKFHEITHLDEPIFKCQICDKSFTRKSTLVCHERLHNANELIDCKTCGKAYASQSSLRRHGARAHSAHI